MQLSFQLRDEGIKTAEDHANSVIPRWTERAMLLLEIYLKEVPGEFMAEDVRSFAALNDFPLPPNPRAWGGIIARAAKKKLIRRAGIGQVKNPKAHCANASIWIKN